jgi:inosine-uridine nucleoside N-ribohydrolase
MVPVILDCDPGHDDALAIALAVSDPRLRVLGITTVAGNAGLERTTRNAGRILALAGRSDVPVAAGAARPLVREPWIPAAFHGESGLDGADLPEPDVPPDPRSALELTASLLRAAEEPVTLVATGPLTNLGLLLRAAPGLHSRIARIVVMGGSLGLGNTTASAEFNIWADPEAAHRVFASGLDVTMVPLDATHQALIRPEDAEELRAAGRVGAFVAELVDFYARFHRERYPELGGSPMHDPLALAYVLDPGLLDIRPAHVEIDLSQGPSYGRTNIDWRGRHDGREPNARVGLGADSGAFRRLLLERITSLG